MAVSSPSPAATRTIPDDGFAVTNADGVPLWDFVRERDLQAIGYPISQRWVNGPFTLQAFQKVILQWDPGKSRMNYYNTLDVLANRYPDVELPNVPPHQVLEADRGADFATITRNHLALLDQNAAIKDRFLSESDWLNLYGLPIRYEEREVDGNPQGLQLLRAQRTVFVIWNVPAPGVTVGRVNLQNVPDKVKKLSNVIIPDGAKAPVLASQVESLPVFSLGTPPAPPRPGPVEVPTADRAALVALYHSTGGPNWITNSNWLSDAPLGEWHGVAADPSGRVTALRLEANGLRGQLPPDLGQLANLLELSLKGNELRGAIPPELGGLSKLLWLWLDGNQLSGAIPAALGNLTNLQLLHLNENQLSGAIPPAMGGLASLTLLNLSANQLQGAIPAALGRLTKLERLELQKNQLSGAIPPELGNLHGVAWLGLNDNQLSGPIPSQLGRLANVRRLYLNGNQLTGPIPAELTSLGSLYGLYLNDNRLTGSIPPELSRLADLRLLHLHGNHLSGAIPPELGMLYELSELRLDHNQLTGAIPPELGNLYDLLWLGLSHNQLTGEIPPELGKYSRLTSLHLQNNQLRGAIPPELESLIQLEMLFLGGSNQFTGCVSEKLMGAAQNDLAELNVPICGPAQRSPDRAALIALYHATIGQGWSSKRNWLTEAPISEWGGVTTDGGRVTELRLGWNQLRGEIPSVLADLPSLSVLILSGNKLKGEIPPALADLSSLTVLELRSNDLSGAIPPALGRLATLTVLDLADNELSGAIPPELGNLVNLSELHLSYNELSGAIPPAIGRLAALGSAVSRRQPAERGDPARAGQPLQAGIGWSSTAINSAGRSRHRWATSPACKRWSSSGTS